MFDYEMSLIKLLGLKISSNQMNEDKTLEITLTDSEDKKVGKIIKKELAKGYSPVIITKINMPNLYFEKSRIADLPIEKEQYELTVFTDNINYQVKLSLGKYPQIEVFTLDNNQKIAEFNLDNDTLEFFFDKRILGINACEHVIVRCDNGTDKASNWINRGTSYMYEAYLFQENKKNIIIATSTLNDDKSDPYQTIITSKIELTNGLTYTNQEWVSDYISEVIQKHYLAIASFNELRKFIGKLIPCEEELLMKVLKTRGVSKYPFTLFIPELTSPNALSKYDIITDYQEGLKLGYYISINEEGKRENNLDIILSDQVISFGKVPVSDNDFGYFDFFYLDKQCHYIIRYTSLNHAESVFDLTEMEEITDKTSIQEILGLVNTFRKKKNRKKIIANN